MFKIEIPNCLIPVSKNNYKRLKSGTSGNALFIFKLNVFDTQLSVYKTPFQFVDEEHSLGVERFVNRINNVGWYIREYNERKSKDLEHVGPSSGIYFDSSLWDDFSEKLIRDKLKDKQGQIYRVNCLQTFATTATYGLNPKDSYFFSGNDCDLKKAFNFSALKLLGNFEKCEFAKNQIERLNNFMYKDFTSLEHSNESRRIGQEADAVFFA